MLGLTYSQMFKSYRIYDTLQKETATRRIIMRVRNIVNR